jgi:ankyrin repeat protein
MWASWTGHVGVVRWLLDQGAAINAQSESGCTALFWASLKGHTPVVRVLLEREADPTIADETGWTPLMAASTDSRLEVVRVLLGHPIAKSTINHHSDDGRTPLWEACFRGFAGGVRALLDNGGDPTIARDDGITPMAVAKQEPHEEGEEEAVPSLVEGRRECVAALEVRFSLRFPLPQHLSFRIADLGVVSLS